MIAIDLIIIEYEKVVMQICYIQDVPKVNPEPQ